MNWLRSLPKSLQRVTSGSAYIPQIDGLRFLAIVPVLIFHAGLRGQRLIADATPLEKTISHWLPDGGAGVTLFFFISGFIIAYPFLQGHAPTLKKFYTRRLLRLEPPYIIVLIGCFLVLGGGYVPQHAPNFEKTQAPLWQSFLACIFYMHSFIFDAHPRLNPPTWSLEREIQFYLLAPFLLGAYLFIRNRMIRLAFGAALVLATLVLGEAIMYYLPHHPLRHSLLAEAFGFVLGVVICDYSIVAKPFEKPHRRLFDIGFVLGIIGLLVSGAFHLKLPLWPAVANDILRTASILLLFFGAARGPTSTAVMSNPWITAIGGACYSIYLVHVPVMQFCAGLLAHFYEPKSLFVAWAFGLTLFIPVGLLAGMVFYVLVERPCMDPNWPTKLARALGLRRAEAPPKPVATALPPAQHSLATSGEDRPFEAADLRP